MLKIPLMSVASRELLLELFITGNALVCPGYQRQSRIYKLKLKYGMSFGTAQSLCPDFDRIIHKNWCTSGKYNCVKSHVP